MARKVEYRFNPFEGVKLKRTDKARAKAEIADLIKTRVLEYVGNLNSPVSGRGKFKALNKAYKAEKEASGRPGQPNLEFHGDLLDSVRVKFEGDESVLYVLSSESDKADGHNNHSGESELPIRRFIPKAEDGETYKREILSEINAILRRYDQGDD
jgi:hypothetical protein